MLGRALPDIRYRYDRCVLAAIRCERCTWQWPKLGSNNSRLRFGCVAMAFGDSCGIYICIAALVLSILSCCTAGIVCCYQMTADETKKTKETPAIEGDRYDPDS